jgi:diadenosine tetraphosphate (Ap4A) HIT family hydrolase
MIEAACELCSTDGGDVLYRDAELRIVAVTGADGENYRGFCRVIWNRHIKEMTDLLPAERSQFMKTVFKLEAVLREQLNPEKMNIASLGNMTPHLHWHVIPRFVGDATYPKPIWATPDRVPAKPYIGTLTVGGTGMPSDMNWRRAVQNAFALKK